MPRTVRHINEVRILDTLFRKGAMSRADLGRELGIMRSTAGNIVADLSRTGLVQDGTLEQRQGPEARIGRPGSLVDLNGKYAIFFGAEIGIGKIDVVAVNLRAEIVAHRRTTFDTKRSDPSHVVDTLTDVVKHLSEQTSGTKRGLNLAVPGILDSDGNVVRAPFLGWSNVHLTEIVRSRLPEFSSIDAENDANAFAMAELYQPVAEPVKHALYVLLGMGVGAGLVTNGELMRGQHGYAGEVGHIFVGENGFAARSTLPGSLESFVGLAAVLTRNRHYGGNSRTIEQFLGSVDRGEASARATLEDWAEYLGRGLAMLTCTLDPERIVLGGQVAPLFRHCEDAVLKSLRKRVLKGQRLPVIATSSIGLNAPAVGAAMMLHKRFLSFDFGLVFHGISRSELPD